MFDDEEFFLETITDLIERINKAKYERSNQNRTNNGEN